MCRIERPGLDIPLGFWTGGFDRRDESRILQLEVPVPLQPLAKRIEYPIKELFQALDMLFSKAEC